MSSMKLPMPEFMDIDHIGSSARTWGFRHDIVDLSRKASAHGRKFGITPAHEDTNRVVLWGIDIQRDFCNPEGALFVGGKSGMGAVDDNVRLARFIYSNLDSITEIMLTQDSHSLYQIFFAPFWESYDGIAICEHTLISVSSCGSYLVNLDLSGKVIHERVRPVKAAAVWLKGGDQDWLYKQMLFYCRKLAESGKHTLYLWPPHCITGTEGHCISGVIQEAVMFHNLVRTSRPRLYAKGQTLLTENYDPAEVEVMESWDGKDNIAAPRDSRFYDELLASKAVIVAGQAKSHCVLSLLNGLMDEALKRDPSQLGKLYILTDCMSPVTVRDEFGNITVDFTGDTEEAFARFKEAGMHLVNSSNDNLRLKQELY